MKPRKLITIYELIRKDGREPGGWSQGPWKVVWSKDVVDIEYPRGRPARPYRTRLDLRGLPSAAEEAMVRQLHRNSLFWTDLLPRMRWLERRRRRKEARMK